MPEKLPFIIRWPWIKRYFWWAEFCVAVASPALAFWHYQDGRQTHAIFWMMVAVWAGRGAMVRYAVHLYSGMLDMQYAHYERVMREYRDAISRHEKLRRGEDSK